MCNVIVAGMSKRVTPTRFLGNYKIINTPFLRGAHLTEAHRICQVVSKNRKLVCWKLCKLPVHWRQMPMPIFQWQRMQHINVWRMVGGNLHTLTCLWLTVHVNVLVIRFPCGREKNMGMYGYTKWTCSQSLTVLEFTIYDLQA